MNLSLFLQGEICAGICLAEAVIIGSLESDTFPECPHVLFFISLFAFFDIR